MSGFNSSPRGSAVPPEALNFAVHSLPAPLLDAAAERQRSGRIKMLLMLAACAAPVVASYIAYFVWRPEGRSNYSTLIQPTRPLPDLPLTALDGTPVNAASLKGQWLLIVVGSGACESACERRLWMQRQLRETLGKDRDRVDKLWLISDREPVSEKLRTALAAAPATTALRVARDALERWLAPAAGSNLEQHVYIVDPRGEWMMRSPSPAEPAGLKRDLDRLLRASASWDRPGR